MEKILEVIRNRIVSIPRRNTISLCKKIIKIIIRFSLALPGAAFFGCPPPAAWIWSSGALTEASTCTAHRTRDRRANGLDWIWFFRTYMIMPAYHYHYDHTFRSIDLLYVDLSPLHMYSWSSGGLSLPFPIAISVLAPSMRRLDDNACFIHIWTHFLTLPMSHCLSRRLLQEVYELSEHVYYNAAIQHEVVDLRNKKYDWWSMRVHIAIQLIMIVDRSLIIDPSVDCTQAAVTVSAWIRN